VVLNSLNNNIKVIEIMKMEYIKPEMELTLIDAELPMALSMVDGEADPDGEVYGRGRRGSWGNLWD
jgi:hypothetical protein